MVYYSFMTATAEPASSTFPLVSRRRREQEMPTPEQRRRIRDAAGVSLQEIADELGVTAQAVWRWENRPPRRFRGPNGEAYLRLLEQLAAFVAEGQQTQK